MKIFIVFIGLMVQVNQPRSFDNTAVLPYAPGHTAELRIPYKSVIAPDGWIDGYSPDKVTVVIPLAGLSARLKGTRGVFSGLRREYTETSPALKTISPSCELRDEVIARKHLPGKLASYFDYRGGRVLPESYLHFMLQFDKTASGTARCAVCEVRYEADLRGNEAKLVITEENGKTHDVRLAPGAEIRVSNLPGKYHPGDTHFEHIYHIYKPCPPVYPEKGNDCQAGKICNSPASFLTAPSLTAPGDDCTIPRDP